MVLVCSVVASAFEGISIGLLAPLLSSMQHLSDSSEIPRLLQPLAQLFAGYSMGEKLVRLVIAVILAVMIKNIFQLISIYLGYRLTAHLIVDLRMRAIALLMTIDLQFFHTTKAGQLLEKVISHTTKVEVVVRHMVDFLVNFMSLLMFFLLMLVISWKLTIMAVIFSALILAVISRFMSYLIHSGRRVAASQQELTGALAETISGIELIKAFGQEANLLRQFHHKVQRDSHNRRHHSFGLSSMHIISESMGVIMAGTMILISLQFFEQNPATLITQILPFIYILIRMLPVVKEINRTRGLIVGNLPFLAIVEDFLRLDDKPFLADGRKQFPGLRHDITFHDVSFTYNNHSHRVLEEINFSLPKGKKTAIVGESGAGKSTVVGLLLRFYDPTAGRISIDGQPMSEYQARSYRETISIVSQDTFIFNDTVMNNIRFGVIDEINDEAVFAAARQAGADDFITAMVDGYNTILGDRGVRLSGGQRQRLAIARAILKNPEILILDEATSALDNQTEKQVHDAIINLTQNRTVIMIAHRLSSIQGADQIIVLKQGRVVEMGDEQTLLANAGEYQRLAMMDH